MDTKATSVVAYLSWIGFLLAYVLGDREGAKFHLNQGAVLAIISIGANIISGVSFLLPFGEWIIGVVNAAWVVLTIIGIITAIRGEESPLPIIGGIQIIK